MNILNLLLLGLGLSMDACAVSISNGLCYTNIDRKKIIMTSFLFGLFQALMPVIGFFAGQLFRGVIEAISYLVAFILLSFIGGKMVVEAIRKIKNPDETNLGRPITFQIIIMQAIATSIDALAVGISLALMEVNILSAASIIGITTFICCLLGAILGKKFGHLLKEKAEILGGIILIGLGIKILLEHLFF